MSKIIWTLIKGLDGYSIDTGDDRFDHSGFGKNTESRTKRSLWGDNGADATKRASKVMKDATADRSMRAGGASAGVSVMMSASQALNHHTANKAEARALAALEPRVREHLPYNYGGVIVVAVFKVINTARMFSNAYVASWAPTPETGLSGFLNRGTISAPNTDVRVYYATLEGVRASHKQMLANEKRTRLMR
ncbi:MAG: hypothetical protein JJU42_11635 [Rhodobacteraceae bacterium]|nr:hypothetical protein [Paracoccaceae bacterium]